MNDVTSSPVEIFVQGEKRVFDLEDPLLPSWVDDNTISSGAYPYDRKLNKKSYEKQLHKLQLELVKLQSWQQASGARIVILFEGRDAAGKGGTIRALTGNLNPRHANIIALPKPSDRERGEWYFQRYIKHFPTEGEMVVFDRSWYNRAGVEPVMGFCTEEQHQNFLEEVPRFERMIVDEGIHFFKIWLNVGQEMQLKRFHDRRHNPLKQWKLSPIDLKALSKWDAYSKARDVMLAKTHCDETPWAVVRSNDKRRARLNALRHVLSRLPYENKSPDNIGMCDPEIIGFGSEFFEKNKE